MQLFYQPGISEGVYHLDAEESRHCVKVLRKHQYDAIDIVDGKGVFYKAQLLNTDPRKTEFEILSKIEETQPEVKINIALAPTKRMERMEWLVEKSTEIGIASISFMLCENSVRQEIRLDRLQRKAVSAMKQSLKATLPQIEGMVDFSTLVNRVKHIPNKYIAHLEASTPHLINTAPKSSEYAVLIGPEGDFTKNEIDLALENQITPVQLGSSRLRTETAALKALVALQLKQEL